MPKEPQRSQFIRSHKNLCANCGQPAVPNLAAHYKKAHQKECVVTHNGEKVTVYRGEHGTWHCLECPATFTGYPKGLQDHVRNVHGAKKHAAKKTAKSEGGRSSRPVLDDLEGEPDDPSNDVKSEPEDQPDGFSNNVKPETDSGEADIWTSLPTSPQHAAALSFFSSSAIPTPPESATPGPSAEEPTSRQPTNPPLPPALDAFFHSLRMPLQHIADVFIENGFETEEALDLLCETPPEDGWAHMKDEILARVRLAGWLAVQLGLRKRAEQLAART